MNEYVKILPKMLSGEELISELTVVSKYNEDIKKEDIGTKLIELTNIYDAYIPSKMSVEIYNKLYLALYHSLRKKESNAVLQQKYENYKRSILRPSNSVIGGSDSFTIIGESGIGKSTAINRAVDVITRDCNIDPKKTKIIPFMTVQCPFDASVKGLSTEILTQLDEILGTDYYKPKFTTDSLINQICTIAINNIGVLIVDEIQNVVNSKGGRSILAFLTQLINNSGISICMVGTMESVTYFEKAKHLARRTIGLKYTTLPYDRYFKNMCKLLLQYQYTKKRCSINEELYRWLYDHSGGNISIIVSLIHDAQEIAIFSGYEILDIKSLTEAYNDRLDMFHKYISPTVIPQKQKKTKKKTINATHVESENTNDLKSLFDLSKKKGLSYVDILKNNIIVEEVNI